jgi:3-hydroxyacyl-CoA dehydrogenase
MGLTIEEVDKLTGPVIGRPKSAISTVDVVGLDTLVHVANGIYETVQMTNSTNCLNYQISSIK